MWAYKVARSLHSLAYAPDGSLWVGTVSRVVQRWEVPAGLGRDVFRVPQSGNTTVYGLHVSADGRLILACSWAGVLWDVEAANALPILDGELRSTMGACLSPDGRLLYLPGRRGGLIWDRAGGDTRAIGAEEYQREGAFSADGSRLAILSFDGVEVHDLRAGKLLARLDASLVEALQFTPAGERLVTAKANHVTVWDAATWQPLKQFRTGSAHVRSLAIHPEGRLLATGGDVPNVSLWTLDGQARGNFDWGVGKVRGVAFSRDGMTAAVAGSSGKLAVWDVEE
jgi:WD40 repeat protein